MDPLHEGEAVIGIVEETDEEFSLKRGLDRLGRVLTIINTEFREAWCQDRHRHGRRRYDIAAEFTSDRSRSRS